MIGASCKGSAIQLRAGLAIAKAEYMTSSFTRSAARSKANDARQTGQRDSRFTKSRNTVMARLRITAVIFALAACGGAKRTDTYARGTDAQGQCCQGLADGAARNACLTNVVRIEDAQVASTSINQATYSCVVEHFVCDPATGRPTQPSAQAQLECIQDLAQ